MNSLQWGPVSIDGLREQNKNTQRSLQGGVDADSTAYLYLWFVNMTCTDWDVKLQSNRQVPYAAFNGNNMNAYNAKNWTPWIYFDGRIISADDLGNINLGYVGTKMGYSKPMLADAVDLFQGSDDPKEQANILYGINMANSGR